ncbi:MAG: polyprenyl synthetase family protein [Pseudomonadota bacterium]
MVAFIASNRARFERELEKHLALPDGFTATGERLLRLEAAMRYAAGAGGKRIRPLLAYAAGKAICGDDAHPGLDCAACAVEMIHCYSLVHDDLPAMDDDDLRRGKPSCHRAFDEATAILVGDALQARALELLATCTVLDAQRRLAMLSSLTKASGPVGMVGGQALDIAATGSDLSYADLRAMHALKTGALIRAAVTLGGHSCGADASQLDALDRYGEAIGLAFQVVDDILDATADSEILGKTSGKDEQAGKATYVSLLGLERASEEAESLHRNALKALAPFGTKADDLRDLAELILRRDR